MLKNLRAGRSSVFMPCGFSYLTDRVNELAFVVRVLVHKEDTKMAEKMVHNPLSNLKDIDVFRGFSPIFT